MRKLQINHKAYPSLPCFARNSSKRIFRFPAIRNISRKRMTFGGDCNGTRTHNHLVRKRTLNYLAKLASLAKQLSAHLRTKCLWVRVSLQSLNRQISRQCRARSSLTFRQPPNVDSL